MIDLSTCRFIVWGYTHKSYSSHTHIHEGIYRALQFMFPDRCEWWDEKNHPEFNPHPFIDVVIITNWDCINQLSIYNNNFHIIHGGNDHKEVRDLFEGKKNYLSWNVYTDNTLEFEARYGIPLTEKIMLDTDVPFFPKQRHMEFRWATDLLPHEIEANKPKQLLSLKEKIIYHVGTIWHVNESEIGQFRKAAVEDGVEFVHVGAGQNGVVSINQNIDFVRRSYMAPSISGSHHLTEGYCPCRIFKNISYGQMGITNSKRVNDVFSGRLIFNADPYKLYYQAKEELATLPIEKLYELMDFVAEKHTYINRINNILEAVKMLQ